MSNLIAFDLEIAKPLPEGETDWKAHRPLGISCAVTWDIWSDTPVIWASSADGEYLPQMTREDCERLVTHLADPHLTPVTWNGLSFDFDILAEESEQKLLCAAIAKRHYDLMYQFFCYAGHYLGLNKAAHGAGLDGKTAGVDGALAPLMWAEGRHQEVIDYCIQDVRTTLDFALWVQEKKRVDWVSARGRPNSVGFPDGLLTVERCAGIPLPDTDWMTDPVPRSKFVEWMG